MPCLWLIHGLNWHGFVTGWKVCFRDEFGSKNCITGAPKVPWERNCVGFTLLRRSLFM